MTSAHNRTPYHQFHDQEPIYDEEKYGFKVRLGWHCKKCDIYWKSKQYGKNCLGMPRYNVRKYRPSHLFTRKELEKKHLKPGSDPEGYVYVLNAPYWIFLYDIGKATKLEDKR